MAGWNMASYCSWSTMGRASFGERGHEGHEGHGFTFAPGGGLGIYIFLGGWVNVNLGQMACHDVVLFNGMDQSNRSLVQTSPRDQWNGI